MNQKQAEALTNIAILKAKMDSDPVIVRYTKLKNFAESVGLTIVPSSNGFEVKNARMRTILTCDTTEELNDWFGDMYGTEVL